MVVVLDVSQRGKYTFGRWIGFFKASIVPGTDLIKPLGKFYGN
jgi:hypothetical protein